MSQMNGRQWVLRVAAVITLGMLIYVPTTSPYDHAFHYRFIWDLRPDKYHFFLPDAPMLLAQLLGIASATCMLFLSLKAPE